MTTPQDAAGENPEFWADVRTARGTPVPRVTTDLRPTAASDSPAAVAFREAQRDAATTPPPPLAEQAARERAAAAQLLPELPARDDSAETLVEQTIEMRELVAQVREMVTDTDWRERQLRDMLATTGQADRKPARTLGWATAVVLIVLILAAAAVTVAYLILR